LRKNKIECFRKLQDAPIAQIRGGFINCNGIICGRIRYNIECLIKLQDAQIAQNKRRIYKLQWDYLRKNKIECFRKLQDAQIAQNKRRIYKLQWDYLRKNKI